jgi:hypothetical protein
MGTALIKEKYTVHQNLSLKGDLQTVLPLKALKQANGEG